MPTLYNKHYGTKKLCRDVVCYVSTFFPASLTIRPSVTNPIKKDTYEGSPKAVGKTPTSNAVAPTVSA